MLDSAGVAMDRLIKAENSKVSKTNSATRIKKEGDDDGRSSHNFKEDLYKAREKKVFKVEAEKEVIDPDIIVSSSLSEKLEEQKRIGKLVEEKFVKNPKVNKIIKFK